jgi:hypothetical protein
MPEELQNQINQEAEELAAVALSDLITALRKSGATGTAKALIIKKLIKGLLNEI